MEKSKSDIHIYTRLAAREKYIDAVADAFRIYSDAMMQRYSGSVPAIVPSLVAFHPLMTKAVESALKRVLKQLVKREKVFFDHGEVNKYAELKAILDEV